jgi:hypothetical protein
MKPRHAPAPNLPAEVGNTQEFEFVVLHKRDYRRCAPFLDAARQRVRIVLARTEVTPIRLCLDPDLTAAIRSGCVADVRAIAKTPSSDQRISNRLDHAIPVVAPASLCPSWPKA